MPCNPVWGCFLLDFPWNRDSADCVTWNHNGNGGGGHSGAIENQVKLLGQPEAKYDAVSSMLILTLPCGLPLLNSPILQAHPKMPLTP